MSLCLTTADHCQKIALRRVSESLLQFWLPYLQRNIDFNIAVNERINCHVKPYYGLIFHHYDPHGEPFLLDVHFNQDEPITLSITKPLITLILEVFLDPLLPEHFDGVFVCSILEIILVDLLEAIRKKTGITIQLKPYTKAYGNFKSQWRVYVNDNKNLYSVIAIGQKKIIKAFLELLFNDATEKKHFVPMVPLTVISFIRQMHIQALQNLKLGEIIVIISKRHPVQQPLVMAANDIILYTQLNDMTLQLTQNPSIITDVEEINMTITEDEIPPESDSQEEPVTHHDDYQSSQALPEADSALNAAVNDYKVNVLFELNRLEVPAKTLSDLTEGSVINLQKPITEEIFLTVAGRTIATGEVVQIGQNFGVLIKELFNG